MCVPVQMTKALLPKGGGRGIAWQRKPPEGACFLAPAHYV